MTRRSADAGVTIMEILIVLAIIALLAAVVAPRVFNYLGAAKSQTAELQIGNIETALRLFYIDVGRYPTESEGLSALVVAPAGATDWNGPYLEDANGLSDPWNRDYLYAQPDTEKDFAVQSLGRDGQRGGDGEDRDLRN